MKKIVKVLLVAGLILATLGLGVGLATEPLNRTSFYHKTLRSRGTIVGEQQQEQILTYSSYATFAVGVSLVATGLFLQTKRSKH